MLRGHVYATEAEALRACEALDVARAAAHGPTEELRTALGPVTLRRALTAGHVAADGSITPAGAAAGLVLDGARVVRVEIVARKAWGARPIPLRDGTYLVPWDVRLDAIEGRAVTVLGQAATVPRVRDVVEVARSERAEVDPIEKIP